MSDTTLSTLSFTAAIAGASAAVTIFLVGWSPSCGPYESFWHLAFQLANLASATRKLDPSDPNTDAEIRKRDLLPLSSIFTRFIMWRNGFKEETMWVQSSKGDAKIKVYIMRPIKASPAPLPLVILFHGGGMVEGSAMDAAMPLCGVLGAFKHRAVLASVEYRLAPKHKFPAAIEDCIDATTALFASAESLGCDPKNISVGGMSAGGCLAAVLHRHCPANNMQLRFCAIFCPMIRFSAATPSWSLFANTGILTAQTMIWYWQCFVTRAQADAPGGFSPLDSQPAPGPHCAPCLLATNSLDLLRDEGREYAALLKQAGVETEAIEAHGGHFSALVTDTAAQRRCLSLWRRAVLGPD